MSEKTQPALVDMTQLGAVIGQAVSQGIGLMVPPREIKEGDPEYRARQEAEGWFDVFDGGVSVYQNAYEANPRGLSAEVRYRAAHLRPGKYLRDRVTVDVTPSGVFLKYPVSGDNRLKNRDYWQGFEDLINKIWAEMHATAPAA